MTLDDELYINTLAHNLGIDPVRITIDGITGDITSGKVIITTWIAMNSVADAYDKSYMVQKPEFLSKVAFLVSGTKAFVSDLYIVQTKPPPSPRPTSGPTSAPTPAPTAGPSPSSVPTGTALGIAGGSCALGGLVGGGVAAIVT